MAKKRLENDDVVILSAQRSPIGKFGGAFKDLSAVEIARIPIRHAIKDIDPREIDEIIMGHVLTMGAGQNTAQQAGIAAGIPEGIEGFTVNRVCASSLEALWIARDRALVEDELVVAGGMESMSQCPDDYMIRDGLSDAYIEGNPHMGMLADQLAQSMPNVLSREQQDAYAYRSHMQAARASQQFSPEVLGIARGLPIFTDEGVRPDTTIERLGKLRPVFGKTITAGNASQLSDGAAALTVARYEKARRIGLDPIARIISFGSFVDKPARYTTAPVKAIARALRKAYFVIGEIDLIEINEAFAVVPLYAMYDFPLIMERVNIWGGAVALGHPIGASGARIVVTLIHALRHIGGKYGLAVACHGGGGAVAVIIENLER